MVGYSRLIGLDDAGTLRRLRTLRRALIDPAIREHGGKVVQTGGDSLLVAFDSIDGAIRCGIKVQQQVPVYDGDQPPDRRIRFRIGINIGDVIPHGQHGAARRRREHRRQAGGRLPSGRHLRLAHGARPRARPSRPALRGHRPAHAEEHRTAGGSLCPAARSGRCRGTHSSRRDQRCATCAAESMGSFARSSACVSRGAAPVWRARRGVVAVSRHSRPESVGGNAGCRSQANFAACNETSSRSAGHELRQGVAPFNRRVAVRESKRREGRGLPGRRHHRRPDHRSLPLAGHVRNRARVCLHTAARPSMFARSARSLACATCWRAACASWAKCFA